MNAPQDPPLTFKLEELAALAGISPRTIRYYVQRGLLPAPQFRGKDTVYNQSHRERLAAIQRLQAQYLPLDVITQMLDRPSEPPIPPSAPPPTVELPAQMLPSWIAQPWQRYQIVPGLELHLASDAGPLAHHLAAQWLQYAAVAANAQADKDRT